MQSALSSWGTSGGPACLGFQQIQHHPCKWTSSLHGWGPVDTVCIQMKYIYSTPMDATRLLDQPRTKPPQTVDKPSLDTQTVRSFAPSARSSNKDTGPKRPRHDPSGTAIGLPIRPGVLPEGSGLIGSPVAVPEGSCLGEVVHVTVFVRTRVTLGCTQRPSVSV